MKMYFKFLNTSQLGTSLVQKFETIERSISDKQSYSPASSYLI
jgi:hypothetical protein